MCTTNLPQPLEERSAQAEAELVNALHHALDEAATDPCAAYLYPEIVNDLARIAGTQWSYVSDDLCLTLLSWPEGEPIPPHIEPTVDVLLVAIDGEGEAIVNGEAFPLLPGAVLLIHKGTERCIRSFSSNFSYLIVSRRRPPLMPSFNAK